MSDLSITREFATLFLPDRRDISDLRLFQVVVAAVAPDHTIDVYLNGTSEFPVGGVRYLDSYVPVIGDVAWALKNGPDIIVIGSLEGILPSATAWHNVGGANEPAFQNNWVNYGSDLDVASFYKDALGWVRLKGMVKSGTANTTVFTLPPGYRPQVDVVFSVLSNDVIHRVTVTASGTVGPTAGLGSNASVSLSGITFPTFFDMRDELMPAFENGWLWDGQGAVPSFLVREDGRVWSKGALTGVSATLNTPLLILPELARRYSMSDVLAGITLSGGVYAQGRVDVEATGHLNQRAGGRTDLQSITGWEWFNHWQLVWTTLSLQNSWVTYGWPFATPSYYKDEHGVVHLRGLAKNGTVTNGTVVATLPAGHRPANRQVFLSVFGGTNDTGRWDVFPNGDIKIGKAGMSNTFASFANIHFKADQ